MRRGVVARTKKVPDSDTPRRVRTRRGVVLFAPTSRERGCVVTFPRSVRSNLDYFISGACSAFSFGAMSFDPPVTRDAEGPWATVGRFLAEAVKETVANHPSLPPLPEDLYSEPECSVALRISAGQD